MAPAMSGLSRTAKMTPRKAARHERILDVACRLTGLHGHDGVSMRTIAAESGTTEKTLYNVYGSKNRLIATAAFESAPMLSLRRSEGPVGCPSAPKCCMRTVKVKPWPGPGSVS